MVQKKPIETEAVAPDQRKLTEIQAKRLGALANIDMKELAGVTLADLQTKFRWRIDPELFLFRRICGKVVKKDPVTGVEYPVPFATVIVEDTDCNLISYFPKGWPWGWFFPLFCHREVLATVKTDKCGNFCVWVPRFDIDWILRWRKERICFSTIFRRPSIKDLLDRFRLLPERQFPPRPGPGPDPGPLVEFGTLPLSTVEALGGRATRQLVERSGALRANRTLGSVETSFEELADARAFETELQPPFPEEFRKVLAGQADVTSQSKVKPHEAIRSAVALQLGVDHKLIEGFDISHYFGPFYRCINVYFPEWQQILDVPDITFRVTQDVNGDGVEETIYSEGFFDVRWDAGPLPDVKLVASSIARETHTCETPDVVCGNVPAILFAGMMPLTNSAYFDVSTGYAKRPNRPIPPVGPRPEAQTPFLRTLQLYGCVNVDGAKYYRVLLSNDNGATFSAITGLNWNVYAVPSGTAHPVAADSNGWYFVLDPNAYQPGNMILEWPTPLLGKYVLKVEIGDIGKNLIATSANVAIETDNTAPTVMFNTLKWKFSSEPDSAFNLSGRDLLVTCPTIHRGSTPQDVDVQFDTAVSAHHLRHGNIYAINCDSSALSPLALPTPNTNHWHQFVTDNSITLTARYRIPASDFEGAYSFGCYATSRGMNPSGGDGGHLVDWFYDPVYVYSQPEIRVAIVNANA